MCPGKIIEMRGGAVVHSGTEIDEPRRPLDQRRQNERSENVDREYLRHSVLRLDALGFAVTNPRIMDHRVEATQAIDLLGDVAHPPHGGEVAGDDVESLSQLTARFPAACCCSTVENHFVALLDKQPARHQAE